MLRTGLSKPVVSEVEPHDMGFAGPAHLLRISRVLIGPGPLELRLNSSCLSARSCIRNTGRHLSLWTWNVSFDTKPI